MKDDFWPQNYMCDFIPMIKASWRSMEDFPKLTFLMKVIGFEYWAFSIYFIANFQLMLFNYYILFLNSVTLEDSRA